MQFKSDSALIFSGGLDSTTLAYLLVSEGLEPHLLSFNYGQRHKKELEFAANTAFKLGLRHDVIDLSGITHLISNSALTSHPSVSAHRDDDIEVPEGHYAEDNMRLTVVPNRNMIMLSIASAVAVNNNYRGVWTGVHAGDHFVYPDCRPTFLRYANGAVVYGNAGFGPIPEQDPNAYPTDFIIAPFTNRTKEEIAKRAFELEVPLEDTWSCYKGGDIHCGRCGTCVERLEAIHAASVQLHGEKAANMGAFDNTRYADTNYWREAVANA